MATISKIRKHSGWVIGSIGIAMLGFLVSDVFTSGKFGFMSHGPKGIAIVAGEDLEPKEFQTKYESVLNSRRAQMEQSGQTMSTIQEAQLNDQVWTEYVTEIINQKEYEKLGINVSGDEILDMVVVHPHKMALQILADPKTGEYNKDKWFGFIKNLDKQSPENKKQWLDLEDAFTKERCKEKYGNLVKNAMYVTDLEAKDNFIGQNKVATVDYVALFTNTIADKDVEVTDKDIEEYINKHKDRFKQEEARSIQYVAFEITPTKSDSDETKTWIDDQVKALRASVNDSAVALRSKGAFSPRWQHRGEFPLAIEEEIFSADTGHIIGPLYENGTYKVYKVSKVHDDSLVSYRGSHILLKTIGNKEEDSAATDKKIKDLLAQIKKGADFAKIATEQSQDQGSALKGGDLGWKSTRDIKDYDPRFGAALKRGKLGDLIVVRSVYGTHLIKITANPNRKAVKVAEVERKIQASDKTSKLPASGQKSKNLRTLFHR